MTTVRNTVYAGIKGTVIAFDRTTGTELWRVKLKGGDFVNLTLDADRLIATTKGEIFCLDAPTGELRWHADLPGMGQGIVSIATALAPHSGIAAGSEVIRQSEEAAGVMSAGFVTGV